MWKRSVQQCAAARNRTRFIASLSSVEASNKATVSHPTSLRPDTTTSRPERSATDQRITHRDVRKRIKLGAVLAVLAAVLTADVFAQQPASVGDLVVPRGPLAAKDHHPSTFSVFRSDVVATISPKKKYVVEEVKTVKSFLFQERYYLRIREEDGDSDDPCHEKDCWVYQGAESSDLEPNLRVVAPDTEAFKDLTSNSQILNSQ